MALQDKHEMREVRRATLVMPMPDNDITAGRTGSRRAQFTECACAGGC